MCFCFCRNEHMMFLCMYVILRLFLCAFYLCVHVPKRLYDPMFIFAYVSLCIFICLCREYAYVSACLSCICACVYVCLCVGFGVCVCACIFLRVFSVFLILILIAYLSIPLKLLISHYLSHSLSLFISLAFNVLSCLFYSEFYLLLVYFRPICHIIHQSFLLSAFFSVWLTSASDIFSIIFHF